MSVEDMGFAMIARTGEAEEIIGASGDAQTVVGGSNKAEDAIVGTATGLWFVGSLISTPLVIYHGYKRNHDSIVWGLLWGLVPFPIAPAIAIAQRLSGRTS